MSAPAVIPAQGVVMAAKLPPVHVEAAKPEVASASAAATRPMLNKEVKLDELSKYFHLPEKAVAKELGICLTSLKKLCRSYGITRWPFRKLKSLERTMRKVQTETGDGTSTANGENGTGGESKTTGGNEVKRKPYTVGNKTVFLSDEELEVFKMTMGKEACSELKPTPITNLEPALFNSATLAAASSALASAARSVPASSSNSNGSAPVAKSENGHTDEENPSISAEVKGTALVVTHWSTLWSQPQLKTKLLEPLKGVSLRVSQDGVTAELEFGSEETANRALRICRMAEIQVMQATAPGSHLMYEGQSILQGSSGADGASGTVGAVTTSPPATGSLQALLSDGCGVQPPSTHAAQNMWSSFLNGGASSESTSTAATKKEGESGTGNGAGPKSIGALGDSLPSPPMSSTTMGLLLDTSTSAPLSMGAPLTALFPSMFQTGADAGNGSGPSPPSSTGSNGLSSYLEDKDMKASLNFLLLSITRTS